VLFRRARRGRGAHHALGSRAGSGAVSSAALREPAGRTCVLLMHAWAMMGSPPIEGFFRPSCCGPVYVCRVHVGRTYDAGFSLDLYVRRCATARLASLFACSPRMMIVWISSLIFHCLCSSFRWLELQKQDVFLKKIKQDVLGSMDSRSWVIGF
jgi:hypothetical protein